MGEGGDSCLHSGPLLTQQGAQKHNTRCRFIGTLHALHVILLCLSDCKDDTSQAQEGGARQAQRSEFVRSDSGISINESALMGNINS